MDAKIIVQMDGKKTRLIRPKHTTIDNNNANGPQSRDNFHDFTFDYSYWSFEDTVNGDRIGEMQPQHVATQDEVYNDLGMDVINCAFQGSYCVLGFVSEARGLGQSRASNVHCTSSAVRWKNLSRMNERE